MWENFTTNLQTFIEQFPYEFEIWWNENFTAIIQVFVIVIAAWLLSHFSRKFISSVLNHIIKSEVYPSKADRSKRVKTLLGISSAAANFVIWLTAGIMILNKMGINTAPILASAGILGLAIGFGTQKLVNDLVSGMFIISENQYRIGDFIEIEGVSGNVEAITLRTTVLRDLQGSVHYVPNGSIIVATNKSMGHGQINIDLVVEPNTNLEILESSINKVGKQISDDEKFVEMIIEPMHFVRITDITGVGITAKVMGKTKGGKQLDVKSAFLADIKTELDKHKIKLAIQPTPAQPKKK